jgi:DNA-binding CsgD family transcriptional regulator
MDRTELRLSLVQGLLAAPGSTEGWERFLTQLCDAFHGSAAKFIAHSLGSPDALTANVSIAVRTDERAVDEYQQHWCRYDPWRNAMSPEVKAGTVLVGDELIARDRIRRTAFYNEFARKYESTQCLAGILEMSPRRISNVSVNRPDSSKRFDGDDANLLGWLMPHLCRAIEVHRRLCGAELMTAHASAALDRVPFGVILIAENGAVVSMNRAAQTILRVRDGLTFDRGELEGATPSITARLRAVMHSAIRTSKGETLDGETALPLPRPSGRRPLSVLIAPLPAVRAAFTADAAAAVFVSDPDAAIAPVASVIRSLYNLTWAESKLVRCLVRGLSVEDAASELGLTEQTTRSRLKTIFEKTNTHRQAELVRMVLTSAAAVTS